MQAQHLIILVGVIIGFGMLTFFIDKALRRAHDRGFIDGNAAGITDSQARFNALNADLAELANRRERERKGFLETIESKNQVITTHQQAIEQAQAQYNLLIQHMTPQLRELHAIANGLAELTRPRVHRSAMKKQTLLTLHTEELDRTCRALTRCLLPNDTDKAAA